VDIRAYKVFLSLAQTLHFGRTASQNDLSASAVSRHLQRLEAHVGQILIERDNRQVQLTPAGRHFLAYARKAVDDWQQIRADLDVANATLTGEVSVFGSVTASYSMLSQILPVMRDTHPGIEIKLRTGDQAEAMDRVVDGLEDSAILAVPETLPKKLACLPLRRTPLCLIGPTIPSALSRTLDEMIHSRAEPDWSSLPVVLAERGLARTRFLERMKQIGSDPKIYATVAGHEELPYMKDLAPFELGLCAHEERLGDPLLKAFWTCASDSYPQA